jgi:hypothetical protein
MIYTNQYFLHILIANIIAHNPLLFHSMHVRRTDHIIEARYQEIEKYMKPIEDWFKRNNIKKKIVYVATDDDSIMNELHSNYPSILFLRGKFPKNSIGNSWNFMEGWELVQERTKMESMMYLLADIYILSMVDYFVGTYSSNISRIVFEIMSSIRSDSMDICISLDHPWYFP